jgi:hypothetical protein
LALQGEVAAPVVDTEIVVVPDGDDPRCLEQLGEAGVPGLALV